TRSRRGGLRRTSASRQASADSPLAPITAQGLVVADALGEQQALDPVDVRHPLRHQRLALAAEPAPVLLLRARCPDHGADAGFATLVRQERSQQRLAIDAVRLRPAPPPRG